MNIMYVLNFFIFYFHSLCPPLFRRVSLYSIYRGSECVYICIIKVARARLAPAGSFVRARRKGVYTRVEVSKRGASQTVYRSVQVVQCIVVVEFR